MDNSFRVAAQQVVQDLGYKGRMSVFLQNMLNTFNDCRKKLKPNFSNKIVLQMQVWLPEVELRKYLHHAKEENCKNFSSGKRNRDSLSSVDSLASLASSHSESHSTERVSIGNIALSPFEEEEPIKPVTKKIRSLKKFDIVFSTGKKSTVLGSAEELLTPPAQIPSEHTFLLLRDVNVDKKNFSILKYDSSSSSYVNVPFTKDLNFSAVVIPDKFLKEKV